MGDLMENDVWEQKNKKHNPRKKPLIVLLFSLVCVVIMYIVGGMIFMATYTSFCDVRDSDQRRVQVYRIEITDPYRLGGIGNIGIGSTRREVERAVARRNFLIRVFYHNGLPPSTYSIFNNNPQVLPDSTFGFVRARTWNLIEFLFDEDDRVIKILITPI